VQVTDIIARARSLTYNQSSANPQDSDIINMINQAQQAMVGWLLTLQPDYLPDVQATVAYISDQQEYQLPAGLSQIQLVEVTDLGYPLRLKASHYTARDYFLGPGEPDHYYWRNDSTLGNLIGFLPTPGRDGNGNNVTITYTPAVADVAQDTDVPTIPLELHPALVYAVCMLMRERDQQPVQDFAALYDDQLTKYTSFILRGRGDERRRVRWRP